MDQSRAVCTDKRCEPIQVMFNEAVMSTGMITANPAQRSLD